MIGYKIADILRIPAPPVARIESMAAKVPIIRAPVLIPFACNRTLQDARQINKAGGFDYAALVPYGRRYLGA